MSGFVGWDTIPEYPDAQEFFDLADGGYMMYAPAVSDMSYGNIKTGVLLPWKASNGGRVCKLAKLFGHGEVSDILISSLPIYYYKIFKSRWPGLMQSDVLSDD